MGPGSLRPHLCGQRRETVANSSIIPPVRPLVLRESKSVQGLFASLNRVADNLPGLGDAMSALSLSTDRQLAMAPKRRPPTDEERKRELKRRKEVRDNETAAKREERLKKDRDRKSAKLKNETEAQKKARLAKKQAWRDKQSQEAKEAKKKRDRENAKLRRQQKKQAQPPSVFSPNLLASKPLLQPRPPHVPIFESPEEYEKKVRARRRAAAHGPFKEIAPKPQPNPWDPYLSSGRGNKGTVPEVDIDQWLNLDSDSEGAGEPDMFTYVNNAAKNQRQPPPGAA